MGLAHCIAVAVGLAAVAAAAQPLQMRATEILGREVVGSDGERLAILDLVIDPATGKVQYLAVGRPGSSRQELRLVPVSALRSVAGAGLVLAAPEESSAAGGSALAAPALVE